MEKQTPWFRSDSSTMHLIPNQLKGPRQILAGTGLDWKASGRNQKGSGYLFLHVPTTLAPNLIFQWTVLAVQNWPKNCWPWMTFLSRSNTRRRFFQFATEEFKCRPLKWCWMGRWFMTCKQSRSENFENVTKIYTLVRHLATHGRTSYNYAPLTNLDWKLWGETILPRIPGWLFLHVSH